jgi:hypothetical protein
MRAVPAEVYVNKILENNGLGVSRETVRWFVTPLCLAASIIFCCGSSGAAGDEADREAAAGQAAEKDAKQAHERPAAEGTEQEAEPKLSFTDEDLKKYQRPKPVDEEDAAVLEGIDEERKATRPPAPQGAPLVRTPLEIAKPPAADPLKEYNDREAREKFRAQQVETLRDRIAGLEKRLAYLQEKRLAIIDPLRIMPQPQGADESAREAGLGSSELLAAVEAEIESTEASLQSAQDNLVTIQTRFGAESR